MKKPALLVLLLVLGAREALPQASVPFVSRLRARAGQVQRAAVLADGPRFHRFLPDLPAHPGNQRGQLPGRRRRSARWERRSPHSRTFPPLPAPISTPCCWTTGSSPACSSPFATRPPRRSRWPAWRRSGALAARITGLTAEVAGDAVRLRFQSSRGDRELLLFRGLQAMRSGEDLTSSPLSLEAGTNRYEDFPIPGTGLLLRVGGRRPVPARQAGAHRGAELHPPAGSSAARRRPGGIAARGAGGGFAPGDPG